GSDPAGADDVVGAGQEVGEGVLLVLHPAQLVPAAAHLATTAHVGDRVDDAAVEVGQPGHREVGVDGDLVGPVAVEQPRVGPVGGQFLAGHERDRDAGAVLGGRPQPVLDVVGRVVAAQDRLALDQGEVAGGQGQVVDAGRGDERLDHHLQGVGLVGGVGAGVDRPDLLLHRHVVAVVHRQAVVAQRQDPHLGQPVAAQRHRQVAGEGLGAGDPHPLASGQHGPPVVVGGGPDGRHGQLEVPVIPVVYDPEALARGRHVILDPLPPRRDDPELPGRVVRGQQAVLRGVLAAQGDDDVLVVAGGTHAHPVALVVLLVDEDVLVGGGADLVPPHLDRK